MISGDARFHGLISRRLSNETVMKFESSTGCEQKYRCSYPQDRGACERRSAGVWANAGTSRGILTGAKSTGWRPGDFHGRDDNVRTRARAIAGFTARGDEDRPAASRSEQVSLREEVPDELELATRTCC